MTHRLTIVATYKAPPGHNRLTDVTLAVTATLTNDGTVTIAELKGSGSIFARLPKKAS